MILDSLRQRVEEAVDIIVRHGFSSTEQASDNVTVAANVVTNTALPPADNASPVGGAPVNTIDNSPSGGAVTGSILPSGGGASHSDHSLLPDMDVFSLSGGLVGSKLKKDEDPPPSQEEHDDNAPLFYRYIRALSGF